MCVLSIIVIANTIKQLETNISLITISCSRLFFCLQTYNVASVEVSSE